jgi:hypothetical protein
MNDLKSTVRYLGYHSLQDGGREFEFSCTFGTAKTTVVTIEASSAFFQGTNRISLQEAAGICFETLKSRLKTDPTGTSDRFDLTPVDVAQHRKLAKGHESRR